MTNKSFYFFLFIHQHYLERETKKIAALLQTHQTIGDLHQILALIRAPARDLSQIKFPEEKNK